MFARVCRLAECGKAMTPIRPTRMPSTLTQSSTPGTAPIAQSELIQAIARFAATRSDTVAVAEIGPDGGIARSRTFGQLAADAAARAHMLADATEVGDVVLAVLPSGIEYAAWFIAAIAAGVIFLPMHAQVAGPEALIVARRAGAKRAIVAPGVSAASALADLALPGLSHLSASDQTTGSTRPLHVMRSRAGAIVLGSSGTTGLPRLALRENHALDADARSVIAGTALSLEDRVLACTPLSHSYGVDMLLATLTVGATLHVLGEFDAAVVASQLRRGITVLPGVPFIFEALARTPSGERHNLRLALSAGSALPARVRQDFLNAWGVQIVQLYGATELGTVAIGSSCSTENDPGCIGRPLAGVSMIVVDPGDHSRRLGPGVEGHLAVAAPSMLSKYLDGEVPTVDGHLLTGDLASIDSKGRVRITGRLKFLIDIGAYKVNPLEVEGVLNQHPGVAECVVVPLVLSDTIQRLRVMYVASDPSRIPSSESLRQFLRERLSPNKIPRVFERADSLPKTPTGKIQRDQF